MAESPKRTLELDDHLGPTLARVNLSRDYPGLMKIRYRLNDGSVNLPELKRETQRVSLQQVELAYD